MADEVHYSSSRVDNKRKFDDPSPQPPPQSQSYNSVAPPLDSLQLAKLKAQEIAAKLSLDAEAKRPKVDSDDYMQKPISQVPSLSSMTPLASFTPYGYGTSKKIDIPNGRVGVIIGRSGDTIKYLQQQSGAKIQVTRDAEALPGSLTRSVEITGTPEQISRAEQLVNEVLAEAEAGGSGAAARKLGGPQYGSEQFTMKIPTNKVGLVIGKGGETIKTMQASSGARIQVIPLHPPPGDTSTERTVQIDGSAEEIEAAKKLVNEVISNENRSRNPQMGGGGFSQQSYHPQPQQSWGPPPMQQQMQQQQGYGYAQPGSYPQYSMPQPPYGGAYSTGYDQTSAQQTATPQTAAPQTNTNYDYYNLQQQPPAYNSQASYGDASYGSYNSQAPQQPYSSMSNPAQDGSGQTYAAPGVTPPVPPAQQASSAVVQPSPTQYSSQPTYGAPPATYGQPPSQTGYGPPPTESAYAQPGYAQTYPQAVPAYGGYSQQQQQGYGDPYGSGGGYAQPPMYGISESSAPTGPLTKASPKT